MKKVSVITPVAPDREKDMWRIMKIFSLQDWPNKELILIIDRRTSNGLLESVVCYGEEPTAPMYLLHSKDHSIGGKLNQGIERANGDILLRMDDDDWYHPSWIRTCVWHMEDAGAEVTGLDSVYFYRPGLVYPHNLEDEVITEDLPTAWLWEYGGRQPYVTGATLAFTRRAWETNPFPAISQGEDTAFVGSARRVIPLDRAKRDKFIAMLHGSNTASHKQIHHFRRVNPNPVCQLMGRDINMFIK